MKIYLGISDDLKAFRPLVQEVVRRLSDRKKPGDSPLPEIEVIDGRITTPVASPDPRSDVFLAMGWLKLDSEGTSSPSELQATRERWRNNQRGRWLLYRSLRLPESLDDIDGGALDQMRGLFRRFKSEDAADLTYREFESEEQFAKLLEEDLSRLRKSAEEANQQKSITSPASKGELESSLHPGEAYEMSFLSVTLGNLPENGEPREHVQTVQRAFKKLVGQTASNYGGTTLRWSDCVGLLVFWKKRRRDSAVMTGLKILHGMPVFNLDLESNPLPYALRIRMAAHDTAIVFSLPPEKIQAQGIDTVVEMQEEHTAAGELTITKTLMERLDPRLRNRFTPRGRVGQEPTFGCHLPSVELAPEQATLEEISSRFESQKQVAARHLKDLTAESDIGRVTGLLDSAYSTLNRYSAGFGRPELGWSPAFLSDLESTTGALLEHEFELWSLLRKAGRSADAQLLAAIKAISRRRARSVAILEKLLDRIRTAGTKTPPETTLDDRFLSRIQDLIRADSLDSETILSDLLLHRRSGLVEFLATCLADDRHAPLLDKLWSAADWLVLDDVLASPGSRRVSDDGILACVSKGPVSDSRFACVERLLTQETVRDLKIASSTGDAELGEDDLQIVGRCLVLGHADSLTRTLAAESLTQSSMWQVLSLPELPIASLHAIGERIHRRENEDAKKIFFDCVRPPLMEAIENSREREDIERIAAVTLLMIEDSFLVESGYFERFDALLRALQSRARDTGVHLEYFESMRRTLEAARKEEGKPGRLPAGVRQLPLTLQRRLAADPIYLLWFVTHPDARIATETIRHIGLANVERVLRLREISGVVMQSILKRPELFTRSETLLTALAHPKCDQGFASHHLPGLARSPRGQKTLEAIARNPSANPTVRTLARSAVMARAKR